MNAANHEKIMYLVPGVGLKPEELERRRRVLNSFTSHGFSVDIAAVATGPLSIESYCDEYVCVQPALELAIKCEEKGYAAVIIGCFGDPGIEALREAMRIPVVGPGETSMHVASMLGYGFSIITILKNVVNPLKTLARKLSLEDKLVSVRVIDKPVLSLYDDVESTKKRLLDEGRKAVEQDGADTLVLGCMSEAFLGLSEYLQNELGVPVVNPVGVSVKTAELLIVNKISHSKVAYPPPPKKIVV
ncbi:MAG: aspartate/glutamate racemase family protein [Candidatus Caldarchaeum sp.]|nr:aspartate/glutamate racemase family protein [Candidatus Caldarchaeum sp.]MDW8063653.1 aspartate/glutamate racemase family protein [Candidatus Caldarchaeum sp.]MDW8435478.1 aspartate/glutamate racemase family protein [Candidatus Caldarchaeum sp.]